MTQPQREHLGHYYCPKCARAISNGFGGSVCWCTGRWTRMKPGGA